MKIKEDYALLVKLWGEIMEKYFKKVKRSSKVIVGMDETIR